MLKAEKAQRIRALSLCRMSSKEIAERVGVAVSTVEEVLSEARVLKQRNKLHNQGQASGFRFQPEEKPDLGSED